MDAGLLVLILRQWLAVVRLIQVTLLLGLLIVVYHPELHHRLLLDPAVAWVRVMTLQLLERVISLETLSVYGHAFDPGGFPLLTALLLLASFHWWVNVSHSSLGTHNIAITLTFFHATSCRWVMLSKHLRALRLLDASILLRRCKVVLAGCSCCLFCSFLCFLLLPEHLKLSNLLLLGLSLLPQAFQLLSFLPL